MDLLIKKEQLELYLLSELNNICQEKKFTSYEIFGKEIEKFISVILSKFLKINFDLKEKQISEAKDKNEFPDLKINNNINIAIEYKSGINTQNPENDMGTFNSWEKKLNDFNDNIYYVFLKYYYNNGIIYIEKVYFDKIYRFIGTNSDNIIKYREKDGNLRPKSWNDFDNNIFYYNDLDSFKSALEEGNKYRSFRIIMKKLHDITWKQAQEIIKYINDNINKNE